ncbi:hypothetical protein KBC04_02410 [Candidatus Babeliales bacterium]|nr:hypothetical protein [Candidatus Babeliales bacterium]MBP9843737.1 hypothetical protein [Candidatus Babeliales bacterium]
MYIKQCHEFYYRLDNFSVLASGKFYIHDLNMKYLSICLYDDFGSLASKNQLEKNINRYFVEGHGIGLPSTQISVDKKNDLIYIGMMPDPCDDDSGVYDPINNDKTCLDLFKEGLVESVHLSKENFFYILRTWDKYFEEKPSFLLLYQDDKDWFDLKPFETRELMEQFLEEHLRTE